jgi:hypothetical protein
MNKKTNKNHNVNTIQLAVTDIELNIKNSPKTYADFKIYKMRLEQCEMKRFFFSSGEFVLLSVEWRWLV